MKARDVVENWPRGHSVSSPIRVPRLFTLDWLKEQMDATVPFVFTAGNLAFQRFTQVVGTVIIEARMEEQYRQNQEHLFDAWISQYRSPNQFAAALKRASGEPIKATVVGKLEKDDGSGHWTIFFSNQTCSEVTQEVAEKIEKGQEVIFD